MVRSLAAALILALGVLRAPDAAAAPATTACEGGLCEICPIVADLAAPVADPQIQCLA